MELRGKARAGLLKTEKTFAMQMRSRSTGPVGSDVDPVVGGLSLAAVCVGVWALVCAARLILAAISFALAPPDWITVRGLAANIFENAICGLFAGLAIGIFMAWGRKPGNLGSSFLSALFNKNLAQPDLDALFWGRVVLSGVVGWIVGRVAGSVGIIALPPSWSLNAQTVLHATNTPLALFIGGGMGGPGGTDFFPLVFLFIVIVLLIIVVALLASVLLHLLLWGVMGMSKGAVKAYVVELLMPRADENGEKPDKVAPVVVPTPDKLPYWHRMAPPPINLSMMGARSRRGSRRCQHRRTFRSPRLRTPFTTCEQPILTFTARTLRQRRQHEGEAAATAAQRGASKRGTTQMTRPGGYMISLTSITTSRWTGSYTFSMRPVGHSQSAPTGSPLPRKH